MLNTTPAGGFHNTCANREKQTIPYTTTRYAKLAQNFHNPFSRLLNRSISRCEQGQSATNHHPVAKERSGPTAGPTTPEQAPTTAPADSCTGHHPRSIDRLTPQKTRRELRTPHRTNYFKYRQQSPLQSVMEAEAAGRVGFAQPTASELNCDAPRQPDRRRQLGQRRVRVRGQELMRATPRSAPARAYEAAICGFSAAARASLAV